ncbi:hypothetical protein FocnCong_v019505 [Fusarium oxysporum f. sp. conglutinans]|nr:hypothetical protein FocnCong_v019505 [Fusarium oxysporum f. sp. conglutinans]
MSPHKPSSTSHTSTSKQPFWHGAGIRSALSSAISIFQPSTSRPSRPPKQVQDQQQPQPQHQHQHQQQEKLQPHHEDHQPQEQFDPIPMSSSPTPDGDPTHSTYEVNVPVRNGRTSEPKVSNPEIRIPRIKPVSESTDQTDAHSKTQSQSPERLAAGLDGKYIDEFGNILDWDGPRRGR